MVFGKEKKLYALACQYDLMIYEDNPYGELRFYGEQIPAIKTLDIEDRVVYAGSFSKILSSGIRVGYIVCSNGLIVDVEEMFDELKKVKINGYAFDNMEYSEDLICTAVPIYDFEHKMVAAMSISIPENRYMAENAHEIVTALKNAAMEISTFLGY